MNGITGGAEPKNTDTAVCTRDRIYSDRCASMDSELGIKSHISSVKTHARLEAVQRCSLQCHRTSTKSTILKTNGALDGAP